MQKSNLIELLKLFTAKEFREFGDFVKSPFFNKNENVVNLYIYIKKYFPDLENKALNKETVYEHLTGRNDYNDGFMRTAIFNLYKLAEDYLAYISYPYIDDQIIVLDVLVNRNADKLFEKKYKQIADELEKSPVKDHNYFFRWYRLSGERAAYNSSHRAFLNVKDFINEEEINTLYYLRMYYFLTSIPEYRFYYNQSHIINMNAEFGFIEDIISHLKRSKEYEAVPLLNLHFHELLLTKEDKEEHFYKLKELIGTREFDNYIYFAKYNCVGIMVNFALRHYYKGQNKFLKERFELHNFILENGLYEKSPGTYFEDMLFKNMVTLGLQLDNLSWVENLIKNYAEKLHPETRDDAICLSYTRIFLYKGSFDEALNHLTKIKNVKHVHYKTEIKILTLMIYYELGKYAEAISVIDNYRHFLSNDALLTEVRKIRNYNFLKFVNELIKIQENPEAKSLYDLEHELKNTPNTYEQEWILRKTESLLKKAI